ncbi:MAG: cysteine hydrolase [Leptospiraceae bacterium]|nr:cysteine hydrolase [Leptospiraceae bacterium]
MNIGFNNNNELNPDMINEDPLKGIYVESLIDIKERKEEIDQKHIALLVIDVQYLDAARGYGVFAETGKSGVPPEAEDYYFYMLDNVVIPNIQKLQALFRKRKIEVIHTRIQSLTKDGRDRSPGHKRLGLLAPPGSKEAEFLEEIAPVGDELIINKTASGVFTSTNLEYILKNMGINTLFVCGVYTNECVSTTVRDASDLGFFVNLIEDACTTVTEEYHEFSIKTLKDRYARVLTTDEAIEELRAKIPLKTN